MRRIETRGGFVKFWRLGAIEFGEQSRWHRAPRSRGLWAFPYPFYDGFFTNHRYRDLFPKSLREATWEEQDEWINNIGKKVLPLREFWYQGDVFTHFLPNGEIGASATFGRDDVDDDWSVMDVTRMTKFIVSSGATTAFERYGENNEKLARFNTTVDHLEVFIAPGMGKIRDKAPGIR